MNQETMRSQMEEVRDELNRLDAQRAALETILRGYETFLRATSANGVKHTRQLAGRGGEPKGSISFRRGVIEVIRQARGEPLHAKIIWERMQEMGVESASKQPVGFIGLTARRVEEIEKLRPNTFRWVGAFLQDSINAKGSDSASCRSLAKEVISHAETHRPQC